MDETQHPDDPSSYRESQSFKQNYAGTFVAKTNHTQENAVDAPQKSEDANGEPIPVELKRIVKWIRDPINHNAIIATFTALIFVATSAYAVIATLQWWTMQGQLEQMRDARRAWVGTSQKLELTREPVFMVQELNGHKQVLMTIHYRAVIKNFGTTPARREYHNFSGYWAPPNTRFDWRMSCRMLYESDKSARAKSDATDIFPESERVVEDTTAILIDAKVFKVVYNIGISGCIAYTDVYGVDHYTEFLYLPVQPDPNQQIKVTDDPMLLYAPIKEFTLTNSNTYP